MSNLIPFHPATTQPTANSEPTLETLAGELLDGSQTTAQNTVVWLPTAPISQQPTANNYNLTALLPVAIGFLILGIGIAFLTGRSSVAPAPIPTPSIAPTPPPPIIVTPNNCFMFCQ
jgi:hypothetical protein